MEWWLPESIWTILVCRIINFSHRENLANRVICTISIIAIFLMFYLHTAEIKPGLKETNHAIIALLVFLAGWAFQSKIHAGTTIKLLSEMTFAIYLFHSWLIRYIRELISAITNNPITSEILSFAVLFLWCYIACKLIEKRGVILGRHFLHSRPHIPNSTLKTTIIKDWDPVSRCGQNLHLETSIRRWASTQRIPRHLTTSPEPLI